MKKALRRSGMFRAERIWDEGPTEVRVLQGARDLEHRELVEAVAYYLDACRHSVFREPIRYIDRWALRHEIEVQIH